MKKQKDCKYLLGPVATKFACAMTGKWRNITPKFHNNSCTYCFSCAQFCPANLITIDKSKKTILIDYSFCKGCGICANICKHGCIEMI